MAIEQWSKKWSDYYKNQGMDRVQIQNLKRQHDKKYKADVQKQEVTSSWEDFGEGDQQQRYNKITGDYSLKNSENRERFSRSKERGTTINGINVDGFIRDPLKGRGYQDEAYAGYQSGNIDPRIAASLTQEDFGGMDEQLQGYSDKINAWYDQRNQWVENEFGAKDSWQNKINQYMPMANSVIGGASPVGAALWSSFNQSEDERKEAEMGKRSSGGQYDSYFDSKYMDEETRNMYNFMSDQDGIDSWATKRAYVNASNRMGEQEGDFWGNLSDQFSQQDAYHASPEYKEQQNQERISSFLDRDGMSDEMKKVYIKQIDPTYDFSGTSLAEAPITPEPAGPVAYNRSDPSTWPENQSSQQEPVDPMETAYDNQQQAANMKVGDTTTGLSGRNYVRDESGWQDTGIASTPNVTEYAEAALPGAPEQVEQSQQGNPWSEDFEKDFLKQMQGYGDTLNSYLGSAGTAPSGPKFSLQGYSRSSAINANTPTNSSIMQGGNTGVKPAQSPTGKAGQKKSTWS